MIKVDENEVTLANRYLNLTYIIAGCLQNSCSNMDKYLTRVGQCLRYDNKHLLKSVISTSHRLQSIIGQLEKISILTCDDDTIYAHDDAVHKYYAILMKVVSIVGSDRFSELRAYHLYNFLDKVFEKQLDFKNEILDSIAFYGTRQRIAGGAYTEEELKCLKICYDEDNNKTSESND